MSNSAIVLAISLTYIPFLLAMQYSKHKWLITHPETPWEFVAILHSEASLYTLLVFLLILWLRSTWGTYIVLTLYYAVCLLDNIAWSVLGRPFHPKDVMRCIELVPNYREFLTIENFGSERIVYTAIPLITAIAIGSFNLKDSFNRLRECSKYSIKFRTAIVAGASAAIVGYIVLMPLAISSTYLHYNSLIRMGKQIYYEHTLANSKMSFSDRERLFGLLPDTTKNAKLRQFNVIFYVIETAPSDYYPDLSLSFKPWADRNGFSTRIMPEHHTTYPESDRSFLSIMTGNYPCLNRGSDWIESYDYSKALPKILKHKGYETQLLSVAPLSFHNEDKMVEGLGFKNIFESSIAREAYAQAHAVNKTLDRKILYDADQEILEQALDIIRAPRNHPFLLAFLPQASHPPFQTPPGYAGQTSQRELLEANARWQMGLMSRIMESLERTGQLQNTILIIVGDHGLRHPAESSLSPKQALLSPLTFKVPFACFCPKSTPVMQEKVTSHIDITPTVLDMLGIRYGSQDYHGRSMLTSRSRTVFFLGGEYLPVSGFTSKGFYFMENMNLNLVLKSPKFDFDNRSAAVRDDQERAAITSDLNLVKGLLTR